MKIAYLIVAHHNFAHLKRLIQSLQDADAQFFIHIDSRASFSSTGWPNNVHFIKRQKVFWGTISQVEVTLNLLKAAKLKKAEYFCLLSGTDYPVKPLKEFYTKLAFEKVEYINILEGAQPSKPMTRLSRFYLPNFDKRAKGFRATFIKLMEKAVTVFLPKAKPPLPVFVGSNWFILSDGCVAYMLKYLEQNPSYLSYFKYTLCPDESFFQTLIGNSEFRKMCLHNLTYTDWEVENPPAEIEKRHVQLLQTTSHFTDIYGAYTPYFARKFGANGAEICTLIDKELR